MINLWAASGSGKSGSSPTVDQMAKNPYTGVYNPTVGGDAAINKYLTDNNLWAVGGGRMRAGDPLGYLTSYNGISLNDNTPKRQEFLSKYSGYGQVAPWQTQVDSATGLAPDTNYVLKNGMINTPDFGWIAPLQNFGYAGPTPVSIGEGLAKSILPAATIIGGPLMAAGLAGMGPFAESLGGLGESMGIGGTGASTGVSNTASAVTTPYIDAGAGVVGTPSGYGSVVGSGSLIPDYTGGVAAGSATGGAATIPGIGSTGVGTGIDAGIGQLSFNPAAMAGTVGKVAGGVSTIASLFGEGGSSGDGTGGAGGMNSIFDLIQQLAGAGIGYASSQRLADQLMHIAERAGQLGDPFQQQPRIPYQGQLATLLTPQGAQSFMSTDPGVIGMMDIAKNKFEAAAGKAGSGGTTYTDYLRNISDILGGQYNNRIDQLATLGGFKFAPNPGGYGQIGTMSALYNAGGLGGLGNLVAGGTPTLNTLINGGSTLMNGIKTIADWFGGGGNSGGEVDMTGFLNPNSMWSLS